MKKEFPEVLEYATLFRVSEQIDVIMSYQRENGEAVRFIENQVYYVDSGRSFFTNHTIDRD